MRRSVLLLSALALAGCTAQPPAGTGGVSVAEPAATAAANEAAASMFTTTPAPADSLRARAWAALSRAQRVEVLSLGEGGDFAMPVLDMPRAAYREEARRLHADWAARRDGECRAAGCVKRHAVLGAATLDAVATAGLRDALREPLTRLPNYASACAPVFRHALIIRDGRDTWELLLCFGCEQIEIGRNGQWGPTEQAAGLDAEDLFDTLLRRAGRPLAPKAEAAQPSV